MKKLITIAIPVFNEAKHIEEVINSILPDLEIISQVLIFDNASTDATGSICIRYARKYPEIIYRRYKNNIGAVNNAINLMKAAKSKYYVQIGGHDVFQTGYLKMLLQKIEDNGDAVNVFGNLVNRNRPAQQRVGAKYVLRERELRSADWFARFLCALSIQDYSTPFYGLSRTETMREAFTKFSMDGLGGDNLILAYMITKGKFYYVNSPPIKVQCRIGESTKSKFKRARKAGVKIPYITPYGNYRKDLLRIIRERKEENEQELIKRTIEAMEDNGIYSNVFIKFFRATIPKFIKIWIIKN